MAHLAAFFMEFTLAVENDDAVAVGKGHQRVVLIATGLAFVERKFGHGDRVGKRNALQSIYVQSTLRLLQIAYKKMQAGLQTLRLVPVHVEPVDTVFEAAFEPIRQIGLFARTAPVRPLHINSTALVGWPMARNADKATAGPVVLHDPAARRALNFLGPFTALDCRGDYTDVRQLWLWQEGTRLYAVGVFGTLISGRRADYVSPIVMGDSEQSGDGWSFAWSRDGRSGAASIALAGADAHFALTLTLDRRPEEHAVLTRDEVFHDEAILLAPLTNKADWTHWFDTVLVGHFASGDIPEC